MDEVNPYKRSKKIQLSFIIAMHLNRKTSKTLNLLLLPIVIYIYLSICQPIYVYIYLCFTASQP